MQADKSHNDEATHTGRAADVIVATVEAQIMSGALPDKSPLPAERELMERFNTSRTVVREAITALSNRGLVVSKPRFRPIVRKPDYETVLHAVGGVIGHLLNNGSGVKNLYDSRVFVERGLVREAALNADRDDIAQLRTALADNKAAISDSVAFYQTDVAFHGVLYSISKNPIFPAIHEGYTSWLAPHWEKMERLPERNLANYHAHERILQGILDRDPDAAERALLEHLDAAWEFVRVTFDDIEP
ncbi:FCD domain-containing protein [Falsihalocynthiibacter sp. SS001]|uniref:FCD domain-containing protein n=1 Tax=Falsihalocynthiibacter sp. SS001 TaxID=3349698 RepID=UPI0036D3BD81